MSFREQYFVFKGEIILNQEMDSFFDATAYVYLENVSLIDTAAQLVAKQVIADVNHHMGTENRVKFSLKGETIDPKARYSIRVHLSLRNDEKIYRGDYISTESYPVLTSGYPHQVLVRVQKI